MTKQIVQSHMSATLFSTYVHPCIPRELFSKIENISPSLHIKWTCQGVLFCLRNLRRMSCLCVENNIKPSLKQVSSAALLYAYSPTQSAVADILHPGSLATIPSCHSNTRLSYNTCRETAYSLTKTSRSRWELWYISKIMGISRFVSYNANTDYPSFWPQCAYAPAIKSILFHKIYLNRSNPSLSSHTRI